MKKRVKKKFDIKKIFVFRLLIVCVILLIILIIIYLLVYTPKIEPGGDGVGELGSLNFFDVIDVEDNLVMWLKFEDNINDEIGSNDGVFYSLDITDAESTINWGGFNAALLNITLDSVEGDYSLNLTATGGDAYVSYSPPEAWDFSGDDSITFWAKSGTGEAIDDGEVFIFGNGAINHYRWAFTYPINWEQIVIDINNPHNISGNLNLSSVDNFRFDVNTAGNSGLIDDVYLVKNPFVTGKFGKAIDFDGINDYVKIPDDDSISLGNQDYTLSAWIYPKATNGDRAILAKLKNTSDKEYTFGIRAGSLRVEVENNANNAHGNTSSPIITTNNWQHVSVVFNSSSKAPIFYYNGGLQPSNNNIDTLPDELNDNLYIGMRGGIYFDNHFNGSIDEVMIFNRALSEIEIFEIYNSSTYTLPPANNPPEFDEDCEEIAWLINTNKTVDFDNCWEDADGDTLIYGHGNLHNYAENISIVELIGNRIKFVPDIGFNKSTYLNFYANDSKERVSERVDIIIFKNISNYSGSSSTPPAPQGLEIKSSSPSGSRVSLSLNTSKTFSITAGHYLAIEWYLDGVLVKEGVLSYEFSEKEKGDYTLEVKIINGTESELKTWEISVREEVVVEEDESVFFDFNTGEIVFYLIVTVLVVIIFLVLWLFIVEQKRKNKKTNLGFGVSVVPKGRQRASSRQFNIPKE